VLFDNYDARFARGLAMISAGFTPEPRRKRREGPRT